MKTGFGSIDLEVDEDVLRVTFVRGEPAEVIENVAVLRDGRVIEAFGTSRMTAPPLANARYSVVRPFDSAAFNPDLADAVTRHLVMLAYERSGSRLRALFGRGTVQLRWVGWRRLSPEKRRSFLRKVGIAADVEGNGRIAVRGSGLQRFLGRGLMIHAWAVE